MSAARKPATLMRPLSGHVDAMVFSQFGHVRWRYRQRREHAFLRGDAAQKISGAVRICKCCAHTGDPIVHGVQFRAPHCAVARITENEAHNRRAVIRRHGITRPADGIDVRDNRCARTRRALDEQRTGTIAVKSEGLGARDGDDGFGNGVDHDAQSSGVFVDPVAKALVGEIEERNDAARGGEASDLAPLVERKVGTKRIVARPLKQQRIAPIATRLRRPESARSRSSARPGRRTRCRAS